MRFFAVFCCIGLAQSGLVRRDAEPEPEADADAQYYGYGVAAPVAIAPVVGGTASVPVCTSVPEKTCVPRNIETPRQVCHQEYDEILDTTITEHCEEVITRTCTQSSQTATHTSAIVGTDSKVVATGVLVGPAVSVPAAELVGYGGHAHVGYGKRDADAEPEADADADAQFYGTVAPIAIATPVVTSPPVCNSVPVKQCTNTPVSVPRRIAKTVCKTVTDVTTIEDCKEVITTKCTQTSQQVAVSSNVIGQDSVVGPSSVVATGHVHTVAGPVAIAAPAVAGYGGYLG